MPTEDGWEPSPRIEPDAPLLVWRDVPGTDGPNGPVRLQVRDDDAGIIMLAYAAAYNKYVEPLRDPDSACYTPTNSVDTSNHLNATAFDFNWNTHPFQTRNTFDPPTKKRLDSLLDYFTGIMFWAGNWNDPVDEMHHQMDYGSFAKERAGELTKWIKAHILPDGTSDYSPDHAPAPPAPPPAPDAKDTATQVLYEAVEAFGMDDAAKWVDEIMMGLTLSRCNTPNRIAGWLAEMGEESGDFIYTEEINKVGPYAPYIGRTWIQITWQSNYQGFGQWCVSQNLITDPNLFVNNPVALADPHWAAIGPAWYWTVERPTINSLCDQGDITAVTKLINGNGASQETIDSRNNRYAHAIALGDRLKALIEPGIVVAPQPKPGGPLDALTPDEQHQLLDDVADIKAQLFGDWPQNSNDAKAAADLDKRKAAGERLTLNDWVVWLKNHVSTHKNPTP